MAVIFKPRSMFARCENHFPTCQLLTEIEEGFIGCLFLLSRYTCFTLKCFVYLMFGYQGTTASNSQCPMFNVMCPLRKMQSVGTNVGSHVCYEVIRFLSPIRAWEMRGLLSCCTKHQSKTLSTTCSIPHESPLLW